MIISVKNYSFSFGKQSILENINFEVCKGDIIGIVGLNGSGKTTLLNSIIGQLKGTTEILFNNHQVVSLTNQKQRESIQYITDTIDLPDYLTLKEYIDFVIDIYRLDKKIADNKSEYYCFKFEMDKFYNNKLIKNFSHGMKKKTQIISALIVEPMLYIFDEPTNGLDIKTTRELQKILLDEKSRGSTMIIASHDIDFLMETCNKIAVLNHHKLSNLIDTDKIDKNNVIKLLSDTYD